MGVEVGEFGGSVPCRAVRAGGIERRRGGKGPEPKADHRRTPSSQTFSSKNPSFSNTTLTRKFTPTPPSTSSAPAPSPFDLEADVYLLPTAAPKWTSAEHNLLTKAPRADPSQMEEYDEFSGPGSFFHLFDKKMDGEDEIGMAETLLEWWGHATECD